MISPLISLLIILILIIIRKDGFIQDSFIDSLRKIDQEHQEQEIIPVCPMVIPSIYKALTSSMNEIISVLAKNIAFRGAAFETLIISKFRYEEGNLKGQVIEQNFTLAVHQVIDQKRNQCQIIVNYPINSLIVCYQNHPTVDLVAYLNNRVYFIQISVQAYSEHKSGNGADEIFKSLIAETGEKLLDYYFKRSSYPIHHGKHFEPWDEELQQLAYFIHITPNQKVANQTTFKKSGASKVILFNHPEELIREFGLSTNYFFN